MSMRLAIINNYRREAANNNNVDNHTNYVHIVSIRLLGKYNKPPHAARVRWPPGSRGRPAGLVRSGFLITDHPAAAISFSERYSARPREPQIRP